MTAPGRVPCINPRCRRTAAREKFKDATWIICRGCWKAMPARLRDRYKQLCRRWKKGERAYRKGSISEARADRLYRLHVLACDRHREAMRRYFRQPDEPVGLEAFLEETGL